MRKKMGSTEPSQTALAACELQRLVPKAKVVYCSATGATEVSNLGYVDRLGLWGASTPFVDKKDFILQIGRGGMAAMELVAQGMKQMGVYMSRGLSFDGVVYERLEHVLNEDQRDIYDKCAEAWQIVLQNIIKALEVVAGIEQPDGSVKIDGIAKMRALSAFWGGHQRFFNQVITSMQMPSVIRDMKEQLAAGNACVLQLVNTNEAAQERMLAKIEEGDNLEDLDMTPRDSLLQLVQHCFPVNQMVEVQDDDGNIKMELALDSQGNLIVSRECVEMRDALLEQLASLRVPEGPLEMILNHFGADNVAEVTGRGRRIIRVTENGCEKTIIQPWSKARSMNDAALFQDDKKKILIFSDAGGTGASYHADSRAKNTRKRIHYLVQAGWVADAAVQGFGRTHRSHQVHPPMYKLVSTDLKGQKRFISTIARRLDQLGALTKGQRQAAGNGMFQATDNLESKYATDALHQFWTKVHAEEIKGISVAMLERQMGIHLLNSDGALSTELPDIRRFLNRCLSLKIDTQNFVFEAYMNLLETAIATAEANGTLDLGVETIRPRCPFPGTRQIVDKIHKVAEQIVYVDAKTKAETKHVELTLSYRSHPRSFESLQEGREATFMKKIEWYVVHSKTGEIMAVTDSDNKMDVITGNVESMYRRIGVLHHERVPKKTMWKSEVWKRLDDMAEVERLWNEAVKNVPEFFEEPLHLITGAILPIWDRLKGDAKVYRLQTDDGEKMLGRSVPMESLPETLRALGVEVKGILFKTDDVVKKLTEGTFRYKLSNDWMLKHSRVSYEDRIELVGPDYRHKDQLMAEGMIFEKIQWTGRYFVPLKNAAEVLERVLVGKPIVEGTRIQRQ